LTELFYDDFEI
jgi:hypothetical protein